jgi:hypothetical protein
LGIASLILWGEATVLENIAPDVWDWLPKTLTAQIHNTVAINLCLWDSLRRRFLWWGMNYVVTRLRAGRPRFDTGWSREGNLFSRHQIHTGSEAHPTSCPMGTGNKATGSWIWLSEFTNAWSYTSTVTYVSMAQYSIKERIRLHGVTQVKLRGNVYFIFYRNIVEAR